MKALLAKKFFGVPALYIALAVGGMSYVVWRKRQKATGAKQVNPAADANQDSSQPYPYSSPDMFPLGGELGQGPAGPPGPRGARGAAGMNAVPARLRTALTGRPSRDVDHDPDGHRRRRVRARRRPDPDRDVDRVIHKRVGNRPAYNARLGKRRIIAKTRARKPVPIVQQGSGGVGRVLL